MQETHSDPGCIQLSAEAARQISASMRRSGGTGFSDLELVDRGQVCAFFFFSCSCAFCAFCASFRWQWPRERLDNCAPSPSPHMPKPILRPLAFFARQVPIKSKGLVQTFFLQRRGEEAAAAARAARRASVVAAADGEKNAGDLDDWMPVDGGNSPLDGGGKPAIAPEGPPSGLSPGPSLKGEVQAGPDSGAGPRRSSSGWRCALPPFSLPPFFFVECSGAFPGTCIRRATRNRTKNSGGARLRSPLPKNKILRLIG